MNRKTYAFFLLLPLLAAMPQLLPGLALTSKTLNISHAPGLADDFSNLVLELSTPNGSYAAPYEIVAKEDGRWAAVRLPVPENYSLGILARGSGDAPAEPSPGLVEVSYFPGLSPDFSNLVIDLIDANGDAERVSYSLIAMDEGKWAILSLSRPPRAGESVSVLVEQPVVQPGRQAPLPPASPAPQAGDKWVCQTQPQALDPFDNVTARRAPSQRSVSLSFDGCSAEMDSDAYDLLAANATVRLIVEGSGNFSAGGIREIKSMRSRNLRVVEVRRSDLPNLMKAGALKIHLDTPVGASLAESIPLIRADAAKSTFGLTGRGTAVCLLDTGVDYTASQFEGRVASGYDFVNGDSDAMDDNGHGTLMASVIHSLAPEATIIPVKVLDSSGHGYSSDIIAALDYCRQAAAARTLTPDSIRVVSMSFGGGSFTGYCSADPVSAAVQDAYAAGLLPVASAGNGGSDGITLPACARNATAVSSTSKSDGVSGFSGMNGMVDLLAPGEDITAQGLTGPETSSGTSLSAAHVSGAAALLLETNPSMAPADVVQRFRGTATFIGYGGAWYPRIDVLNAIMNNATGMPEQPPVEEGGMSYGGAFTAAEWWDSAWQYKRPINISVSSGATDAFFQVQLLLNATSVGSNWNWTNECVNSNSSRIRFVNASDTAELDFWVENCSVTGQNMTVWVEVDGPITAANYTFYLYYGNWNASANSNGTNTFVMFDDFSNGALGPGWATVDADNTAGTNFTVANGMLNVTADGTDIWTPPDDQYGAAYRNISGNFTADVRIISQTNTNGWAKSGIMVRNNMSGNGSSPGYAAMVATPSNGWNFQWDSAGDGYLDGNGGTGTTTYPSRLRFAKAGGNFTGYYGTDGIAWTRVASALPATVNTSFQQIGLGGTSHSSGVLCQMLFDDFKVSKYHPVAPVYYLGAEEEAPPVVQSGSFAMTVLSQNVSIRPVNTSRAFILLSTRAGNNGPGVLQVTAKFVNSTAIRFDKYTTTSTTIAWYVVEGNYFTVQAGEDNYSTTNASFNKPIAAVNISNSFIIVMNRLNSTTANQNVRGYWTGEFMNSTAIRLERGTTGSQGNLIWQVVSWAGATVQSGKINATSGPANATITAVNLSSTFLVFSRRAVTGFNGDSICVQGYFQNSTAASFHRVGATGATTVSYFVVSSPNITVQSGNSYFTGVLTANETIAYVNTSRAFSVSTNNYDRAGTAFQRAHVTNYIVNYTTLQLWKATATDAVNNSWFAIEFRLPIPAAPVVTLQPPSETSGTTLNRRYILVNASATPLYLANITLSLYNSSGSLVSSSTGTSSPQYYNFSGLADAMYYFNATACNVQGACAATETRNVTLHGEAPRWSDPSMNVSTVYWNTSVKFNATWANAALAGYIFSINQSGWANSSYVPFTGTYNVSENATGITASPGTVVGWYFWANDSAGNYNSTPVSTFTVEPRPTALNFSLNQTVFRQLTAAYPVASAIPFSVRYVDLLNGNPVTGATCNVTDNETSTTTGLAYNSTTGNYTGQMNATSLYGNVTFTANCSLTNYSAGSNATNASVRLFFYLWEDMNRTFGPSNASTTWLELDPPSGPIYTHRQNVSAPTGASPVRDFHVCGLGANCVISRDYLVADIGTLRLNVSINDTGCRPYLCYFFKDASLAKYLEVCTPDFTLTANTPTLLERNASVGTALSQTNYLGMSLYLNCTSARNVSLNVTYNYSAGAPGMEIWSPQPMPITAYAAALYQLDLNYSLGPNRTLNVSRRAVITFNNSGITAKSSTYYWQTRVQPQYANSIMPNSSNVYNSTGGLWASDNASGGAPYWAIAYPDNQISWTTETVPASTAVNETVDPRLLNALRDNETLAYNSSTSTTWNVSVVSIFTPSIRADNVTVWTNYSAYGVPDGRTYTVNMTNSTGTYDISGSVTVNATAKTVTFPLTIVNGTVVYVVTAAAPGTPPNVTVASPLGGTYKGNGSVSIAVNATDAEGVDTAIAQVALPNGTKVNWTLDFGQPSDNFTSDSGRWVAEDESVGGQSCTADISATVAGKASTSISGDGSPETDGFCNFVSARALDGDFDINISFALEGGGGPLPDSAVNFLVADRPTYSGATRMILIALANWSGYQREYEMLANDANFSAYLNWTDTGLNYRPTDDTSGRFRMKRAGNNFTFYTWNSSNASWTFENVTPVQFDMPRALYVIFGAESASPSWSAMNVSWDNFSVSNSGLRFAPFNSTALTGAYNVTLFVNDTQGAMNGSERTNFTIQFVNHRPSVPWLFTPYPDEVLGGQYEITWSPVSDLEGDSLRFNITLLNGDGSPNSTIVSDYGTAGSTSYQWNTSAHPDGTYVMNITVFENETPERLQASYLLEGTLDIDNTPPTVNFTSPTPAGGDIIPGGVLTLNVTAADSALSQIYIHLNETLMQTCISSPCTWAWNASAATDGPYRLRGSADDAVGNTNSTETRTVWVFKTAFPGITNLTFAASSPDNYTTDNLTCSYALNGTATAAALAFYRNGTPVTPIYLPFEAGPDNALTDMSGSGNNLTNNNSAWNATAGYNGTGAFMFNGVNSTIYVNSSASLNFTTRMSITAWVYPLSHNGYDRIVAKSFTSNSYPWTTYGLLIAPPSDANVSARNATRMEITVGGTQYVLNGNTSIPLNQWSLLGVTFNGSVMRVYLNDHLEGELAVSGSIDTNNQSVTIGADAFNGNMFNGTIDEVRMYNYVLPVERMQALYANRTNVIPPATLRNGDVWQCMVTPFSSTTVGPSYLSGSVTVNSPPPLALSLLLNATSPYNLSTDNLTCNYALGGTANSSAVAWYRNGTPLMLLYLPFEGNASNALLDRSGSGNNCTNNGTQWNASGGYAGTSGMTFPGGSYLTGYDLRFPAGNFTISLWFRTTSTGPGWLLGKISDTNYYMNVNDGSVGYTNFGVYDGSTYAEVFVDVNATNGQWHHAVMRVNSSHVEAFVDGTSRGIAAHDGTLVTGAGAFTIGGATGYADFNGTMDEVRIYNYTLASSEIVALYQNRTNVTLSQRLAAGDVWQCLVTPFSPAAAGSASPSNNVTINAPYAMTLTASNLRNGTYYSSGDGAVLNITITLAGVPYDPPNLTVYANTSGGTPIANSTYPGGVVRTGTGTYYVVALMNSSIGSDMQWSVYAKNGSTQLATASTSALPVNAANGSMNLSLVNGSGAALAGNILLYDRNSYLIRNSTSAWSADTTLDNNYTVKFQPANASLEIYGLNITSNVSITAQYVDNYAGAVPVVMQSLSPVFGLNASEFNVTGATVALPKNGLLIDHICKCADWSVADASCAGEWACSDLSSYEYASNATHFWFNVTSFSGFAGGPGYNANLSTWDSLEVTNNSVGGVGDQVTFYANYSNSSSGASINGTGIYCSIIFNISGSWTPPVNMTFNGTSRLYEYNRSFTSAGNYTWNATCNGSALSYSVLVANDTTIIAAPGTATLKEVYGGSLSLGAGNTTAAIGAAINASASILFFSVAESQPSTTNGHVGGAIINSTHVFFERPAAATGTLTVKWYVAEFSSGVTVLRGKSSTSSSEAVANIGGVVNLSSSFVVPSGYYNTGTIWGEDDFVRYRLLNSTYIALTTNAVRPAYWQVVEFGGAIVQRNITVMSGNSTDAALPVAVETNRSFLLMSYRVTGVTVNNDMVNGQLLNSSTVRFARNSTDSANTTVSWEVVQLPLNSTVQQGFATFVNNNLSANITINSSDLLATVALSTAAPSVGQSMGNHNYTADDNPGIACFTFNLTNETTLNLTRASGLASAYIGWTVISFYRPVPGIANLTLNATSANNYTMDNLTCNYALNGTATTAAVAWYRNSTPVMLLYMPMEGNLSNAMLDYSGNGLNITNRTVETWNATGGYDGKGAFDFNGSQYFIVYDTNRSPYNITANFTVSLWVYARSLASYGDMVSRQYGTGAADAGALSVSNGNQFSWFENGGTNCDFSSTASIATSTWYFLVLVVNGTNRTMYVNGALNASRAGCDPSVASTSNPFTIGAQNNGAPVPEGGIGNYFNGTLDDVRIWNTSLSAQQISAIYQNRTNVTTSEALRVGDVWECLVTPFSSTHAGSTSASNNITILASMSNCPVITSSGSYQMAFNFVGAPNNASPVTGTCCVKIAASNVTFDCNGYNITNDAAATNTRGILVNSSFTNVTIKNCYNISNYRDGIYLNGSLYGAVVNNTIYNLTTSTSIAGVYMVPGTANITVANNTVGFTSGNGFYIRGGNHTFVNNTAYNCSTHGIRLEGVSNSSFTNNSAYRNLNFGFYFAGSNFNNTLGSNLIYNNSQSGIYTTSSYNNTFVNNSIYNNRNSGLNITGASYNNTFVNNSIYNNTLYGIYLVRQSNNNSFTGSSVFTSPLGGMFIVNSTQTAMRAGHYFNNTPGFTINSSNSPVTINLSIVAFDNPAGNYSQLTNISINDSVEAGTAYLFRWATNSSALPPGYSSFAGKFINFTNLTINVSIDAAAWTWTDAEATGHAEADFSIWRYDAGGWTQLNASPDTSANTLSLFAFTAPGIYAILEQTTPNCPVISVAGTYNQSMNYTGAPNSATPLTGYACVVIAASNVVFDCKGYYITNSVAGTAYGILLNGSLNNVTVRNCPGVSNYTSGIYSYQSGNGTFTNNSLYNNTGTGIYLDSGSGNNASLNSIYYNAYGIYLANESSANISLNNVTNNTDTGIRLDSLSGQAASAYNRFCFNALMDAYKPGTPNEGAQDACDAFAGWRENGHIGCEYSCSSLWHRFFGNITGTVILGDSDALLYRWNGTGFRIYFADYDTDVHWTQLQAIGRNTSNGTSSSDFMELDTAFGSTPHYDNITALYSTDGSAPKQTQNFTVFDMLVNYIPLANSTVYNTTFTTGILWDTADGGEEYSNAFNQSTVWAVRANATATDAYGAYDFLGQVPYTLSNYTGSTGQIAIYVELN